MNDKEARAAEMQALVPPDMTTVYVEFLWRGPTWSPEESEAVARLQIQHLTYLKKLRTEGRLLMSGPFTDGGQLRGMCLLRADSVEEAQALAEADPAVQAGRLKVEIHPWWVSARDLVGSVSPDTQQNH